MLTSLRGGCRSIQRSLPRSHSRSLSHFPINDDFHGFTPEQKLLRDSVFSFSQSELAPLAEPMDRTGSFPEMRSVWQRIGAMGYHGVTVGEEFGGAGLGFLEHCVVLEELSRANGGLALSALAHGNLCANQLYRHGTESQCKRLLPGICSGELIGGLAMSEPESGSDVMSMRTSAVRDGDGFLINGTKMWITNGPVADLIVVYAKTDPEAKPSRQLTTFLIERGMEGFSSGLPLDKLGLRGSPTSELVFSNCRVGTDAVLGGLGNGAAVLMSGLYAERLCGAALAVGGMQAALDVVLPYVNQRKQFGSRIGDFQLVQAHVSEMFTRLQATRCYVYATARAADNGCLDSVDSAAVIALSAENADRVSVLAIQCLGGNGYINDYPVGRLWRDAKLGTIGAGTQEVRKILIARELNKLFR